MRIVYWCDRIGNSAAELGQLALAPCGGHAVVTGGTAHGVVGNAAAAEAGQLVRTVAKGSGNRSAAGDVLGVVIGILLDASAKVFARAASLY